MAKRTEEQDNLKADEIGKEIAEEYQLGYTGLGDKVIADLIAQGARKAFQELRDENP